VYYVLSVLCFCVFRTGFRSNRKTNYSEFRSSDSGHFDLEGRTGEFCMKKGRRAVCRSCGNKSEKVGSIDLTNWLSL
jgi:hypothetical protein